MGKSTRRLLWVIGTVLFGLFVFISFRTFITGGLAIGDPIPPIDVATSDGRTANIDGWRGRGVVLRFSSVACAACADDFDLLDDWQRQYGDEVQFIAVQAGDTVDSVRRHLTGRSIDVPIWVDPEGRLIDALGLRFVPAVVFVTSRGTLSSVSNAEVFRTDMPSHLELLMVGGPDMNDRLKEISLQLRCQECEGRSVWESDAPSSLDMRRQVHRLLLEGLRKDEVLAAFEADYGPWILMAPPVRGFTALVWVLPFSGLFLGLGLLGRMMHRARRRSGGKSEEKEGVNDHDVLVRRVDDTLG